MRSAVVVVLALLLVTPALAQKPAPVENVSSFEPREPAEERKALHVPPGFEVQLVAAEPEIHKPMNIAFDDRGRLWVTSTVEYPYPVAAGKTPRDKVLVLDRFGPDGRAGRVTTFAEGLNIPIGVLPLAGGERALVHSIPNIYLLTDVDGDGKADKREPWYTSIGFRDTHGMTNAFSWGFDGWIYACHGFSNESEVQGSDKRPIKMQSGNVYRMKPDGSHVEYYTHGQVNPFGLSFDPRGNLYSADCHSKPLYQLLRGAYYPSFGKPDDGLGFGPEMVTHDHGSTAIDAPIYYAADNFPTEYRGRMFVGNVVTNRINQDRIEWHGSSPKGIAIDDFVWSEDNWFRPVDMEVGPDGALYIADFYNRIIGHYEVPLTHPGRDRERGRIWRVVYRGTGETREAKAPREDWTAATIDELVDDLGHPNLAVRIKATNQLVRRLKPEQEPDLLARSKDNSWRFVHALWVLQQRGRLSDEALEQNVTDTRPEVRVHLMRILAERPDWTSTLRERVVGRLNDQDALVRRCAAEALGRHPDPTAIRPLLRLRQSIPADDTHLLHVVRMALRDQLLAPQAWEGLSALNLTEGEARDIADVAPGVATAEAAAYLLRHVERLTEPVGTLARYIHHIARYGSKDSITPLVAFVRGRSNERAAARVELLKAIQQGMQERGAAPGDDLRSLAIDLANALLDSSADDDVSKGINLVATFPLPSASDRIKRLAQDGKAGETQRAEALSALVTLDPKNALSPISAILGDGGQPISLRESAAAALAGIDQADARSSLLDVLPKAPERLQATIAAGLAGRKPGAEALLDAIAAGKASARLLQENRVVSALGSANLSDAKERVAKLLHGLPPADQKLKELLVRRRAAVVARAGDVARGAALFEKNCAACHQIGGKGARVGPQLDGIGTRGADRLVEDVLDPNRNVDQTFRASTIALKSGQVVTGLLLKEEGEVLVLADAQGKEVRIPKDDVEDRKISPLSPMPASFADQIGEDEFRDLVTFLLSNREGGAKDTAKP
ncbi:MAG: c-type cytochrome [Isosphaeraceae bacterium]|nr:c-type cytochrome [Isosphaeraceae bacterium]